MKKASEKIQEQIVFYAKKLPPIKQVEALDFIKWLWGGPKSEEAWSDEEINKIEALAKKKNGKKFSNWVSAKRYLEGLMH